MGPLVVAAVMIKSDKPLREMQVRDSKQLPRSKREELAPKIREVAKVEVIVVPAEAIDALRDEMSLNVLEAQLFASLLDKMAPQKAYVDAADVVEDRFKQMIESHIGCEPEIICEHSADKTYPVVMAASIIAKTVRDDLIDEIQKGFSEPIGSGYAHDVVTRKFLEGYIRKNGCFPPNTRKSWKTAKEIYALTKLTKLTDWVDEDDNKTDA